MKASLKLRDDAGPLLRAKLPVAPFSVPAVASLTAGDPADLRLSLATAAASLTAGDPADLRLSLATAAASLPSLRLSYAPNRPAGTSPLSLALVLGPGPGGCPSSAPAGASASAITMAVEVTAAGAVSFSLSLKPSVGDFAVRKRFESVGGASASELTMRSVLPVRGDAATVRVRWGVRIPAEVTAGGGAGAAAGVTLRRLPFLVLGKVTVETRAGKPPAAPEVAVQEEAAVEKVRKVNEKLRKEVEELRATAAEGRERETTALAGTHRNGGGSSPANISSRKLSGADVTPE
uniref:Uncharacterized protein n=1 Tax=Avena sativa TaxID=4498 RepID=A0ACD5XQQ5_AVESA